MPRRLLRGSRRDAKTRILFAPSGGLEPAVLPMSGASGPATQTLTPARYDNSQTYYAHMITVGAVTLTASRYDNAQTFYTHVITQAVPAQNLSQTSRYDNSQTYYTHTLTVGAVTLTPSRFDNSHTFYIHSVALGAVTLSPIRFDNAQTFYANTLTVGAVTLTAARFDNAQTFYTHEITNSGGFQSLTQDARFDNSQTFYTHTLSQGPSTQYLVAIDHVESGWVDAGWVGWPYFNTQTFYEHEAEQISVPVVQGGNLWGYGKKLHHPWLAAPRKIYEEILEEELPDEIQDEAIEIIRPYIEKKKKAAVPQPATIDWKAFAQDSSKVSEMLRLWEEVVEIQRMKQEEQDNIDLLLLAA